MILRVARAVLLLPGTVLGLIPALLIFRFRGTAWDIHPAGLSSAGFWIGFVAGAAGLSLGVWTVSLFVSVGEGTPAPWDPPKKFVVRGPYRHVRNPMIVGILLMLSAEALILHSWPIAGWLVFFKMANILYIPGVEEKMLEARFGEDYRRYKANVPRWVPRLTAWL